MHPSRHLLALLAVLALLTAACGSSVETGASEPSSAPPAAGACLEGAEDCEDTGGDMGAPPPDADQPVSHEPDPDAPVEPSSTEVEPTDGLEDVHPVSWEGIEVDPDDQSRVTVRWTSGVAPCHAFAGVEVEYRDDAVVLTVLEGSVPADEPQACIELAQAKQATIQLDEEIGPRSIEDGAEA